jgi:HAD superfamily hydrolase (TIGR01509 family)
LNQPFDLIIFDCDGVLVDSERIANAVFARVLAEVCGLQFTLDDMFDTFVGHSRLQCLQKIEVMIGEPPPAELDLRYQRDIDAALAETVQAIDGIEAVLETLSLPYCVASSGSHEKMKMTLGKTNLLRFVEGNIFSTTDVERGKPYPDIYLHAARSMGVTDPARCAVVEDSAIGVTGAVAAGMRVFGFAELMPAHRLHEAGAHQVFERMSLLPDLLVT